jgi:hypothetical protein
VQSEIKGENQKEKDYLLDLGIGEPVPVHSEIKGENLKEKEYLLDLGIDEPVLNLMLKK